MIDLTQYKDIFGAPRTGVHSFRFLDFAVVDVASTAYAAYATAQYMEWRLAPTLAGFFAAGIFAHWLFGVETKLTVA